MVEGRFPRPFCGPLALAPALESGRSLERRRTITGSDNQRFWDPTMNGQPLHLDAEFGRTVLSLKREVRG